MEVIEIFSGKRQFLKSNQVLETHIFFLNLTYIPNLVEFSFNHCVLLYGEDSKVILVFTILKKIFIGFEFPFWIFKDISVFMIFHISGLDLVICSQSVRILR